MVSVKDKENQRKRKMELCIFGNGEGNEFLIKTAGGVMGDNWDKSLDDTEINYYSNSKALWHSELPKTV